MQNLNCPSCGYMNPGTLVQCFRCGKIYCPSCPSNERRGSGHTCPNCGNNSDIRYITENSEARRILRLD
jgi:predicted  nucleic acid-binding Zn-ribbon protein